MLQDIQQTDLDDYLNFPSIFIFYESSYLSVFFINPFSVFYYPYFLGLDELSEKRIEKKIFLVNTKLINSFLFSYTQDIKIGNKKRT